MANYYHDKEKKMEENQKMEKNQALFQSTFFSHCPLSFMPFGFISKQKIQNVYAYPLPFEKKWHLLTTF